MNGKAFALSSAVPMHGNSATSTLSGLQSDTKFEFRVFGFASSGNIGAGQNDVKNILVRAKFMQQLRYFSQILYEITQGGQGRMQQ